MKRAVEETAKKTKKLAMASVLVMSTRKCEGGKEQHTTNSLDSFHHHPAPSLICVTCSGC